MKSYKDLPPARQILSEQDLAVLHKANTHYRTKGFEYMKVLDALRGFSAFPDLAALDALAKKVLAVA